MSEVNRESPITDLIAQIDKLQAEYKSAAIAASEARSREIAATNDLSNAQRAIDKLLADFRKSAPRGTHWYENPNKREVTL